MYNLNHEFHPEEHIVCSGQPHQEDFERLANNGFKTVVSLRPHSEYKGRDVKKEVEDANLQYFNIPISHPDEISQSNAQQLEDILTQQPQKILVFCGSSNRVGALFALKQYLFHNASVEEAISYGESAGLASLKETTLAILSNLKP